MQPSNTNTYVKGTAITVYTDVPFTAIDGTIVDPDRVLFGFEINGDSDQTYTFAYNWNVGDPTETIQRIAQGVYSAEIDSSLYPSGVYVYTLAGEPTEVAHDYTKTKVRVDAEFVVIDPPFALE